MCFLLLEVCGQSCHLVAPTSTQRTCTAFMEVGVARCRIYGILTCAFAGVYKIILPLGVKSLVFINGVSHLASVLKVATGEVVQRVPN